MNPQEILNKTRKYIRDYAGSDPDKWFYANRFVFARLQLDERRTKTPVKKKLLESNQSCYYCKKHFENKTDVNLHRFDDERGYSLDNCVLMHSECHKKFHTENPRGKRTGRPSSRKTTGSSPILEKFSKRHDGKSFTYWWDISPGFLGTIDKYEKIAFVKKDTDERCYVPISVLKGYLTEERKTTRGNGNWGIKVLKDKEDQLAFEPGSKNGTWLFLPVVWLTDEINKMAVVAGVDGCKTGWLCAAKDLDTGLITSAVFSNAQLLLQQEPEPSIITVDIPIGLTKVGPRQCDIEARQLLGPRRSSVFPAPIRPALQSKTRQHADEIRRKIEGKGVSAQSFAIYKKVIEFDNILSAQPHLQNRVKEIHPEVCFWAWNNKRPMSHNKKSDKGRIERYDLVVKHFGVEVVGEIRAEYPVKCVSHDDIYDAFAALWTAERIFAGNAGVIPDPSPCDAMGLHMEMWY